MPRSSTKKFPPAKAGTKRRLEFDDNDDDNAAAGAVAVPRPKQQTTLTGALRNEKPTTTSIKSFMSPVSNKSEKRSKVVTPEEEKKQEDDTATTTQEGFVPKYIHKNLSYYCHGDSKLDPITQSAFEQVVESHVIPRDLEKSRSYGPKSGSSFEDRVLAAYALGQLTPRDDYEGETRICTACANKGHKRDECPTLV